MSPPLLETPLHAWHVARGARMVPFAGWSMPVQYPTGILAEHRATRAGVGLFDISHMGRVEIRGRDALALLQRTTTNDVARLGPGRAQYSLLCNGDGGTLDDLLVYRLADRYLAVVNAGTRERDLAWWREHATAGGLDVQVEDRTFALAMLAVQGPGAQALVQPLVEADLGAVRYYSALSTRVGAWDVLVARTGYTGEDGFELLIARAHAVALWEALLAHADPPAPTPAGLGARDTLRIEAGMALYGHELTELITPLEAGLARFVQFDKGTFVGREALLAQRAAGVQRTLVGFEMVDSAVPREGYALCAGDTEIGRVTSGTYGPTVDRGIGLAYLPPAFAAGGTPLTVAIRGRPARARVVPLPFWSRRRPRPTVGSPPAERLRHTRPTRRPDPHRLPRRPV